MRDAARAIGAAEARQGKRQGAERRVERAFAPALDDKGAQNLARHGELVDMPMGALVAAHMARQPGAQPAGAICRAAIEIIAGLQCAGLHSQRRGKPQPQGIGARACGGQIGGDNEDQSRHLRQLEFFSGLFRRAVNKKFAAPQKLLPQCALNR